MTILICFFQSLRPHAVSAYNHWPRYLKDGLREAGLNYVEVPDVDWAEGMTYNNAADRQRWKDYTWSRVLDFVKTRKHSQSIDFLLSYLFPQQIEVAAIKQLRACGIPCVNFFCDNVREFRSVPTEFCFFDLHWVPEYEAVEMYERARLSALFAPMPCWIPFEFRSVPTRELEPPTFIGSPDVLRRDLFGRAVALGVQLRVRGTGWTEPTTNQSNQFIKSTRVSSKLLNQIDFIRRHGIAGLGQKILGKAFPLVPESLPDSVLSGPVSDDEYFRISREAVITLGVNRVSTFQASDRRPIKYSRLRDIEAPMLGACYLTEHTVGIDKLFETGPEIETYSTAEELAFKIDELACNSDRRKGMRSKAQQRALNDHSVPKTLERILQRLGLCAPSE